MKYKKIVTKSITSRIAVVLFLVAIGAIALCQTLWVYPHVVKLPERNFISPCAMFNSVKSHKLKTMPYAKIARNLHFYYSFYFWKWKGDRFYLARETKKVTMMLNTFQRPQQLLKSIKHYSQCQDILQDIRVVFHYLHIYIITNIPLF